MRLFLAFKIEPDKRLKQIYFQIKKLMKGQRVKFYSLDEMFLILRYLPEAEPEYLSDINRFIAEEVVGYGSISVSLQGVDIYPYKVMPRVLWFRAEAEQRLMKLAENLDKRAVEFGFAPEFFSFYPHVTFARIRRIEQEERLDILEQKFKTFTPINFSFSQLILFESLQSRNGNIYRIRNRFSL